MTDDRLHHLEQTIREHGPFKVRELRETALRVELDKCDGHKPSVAERLAIGLRTLYDWMREFKLKGKDDA